MKLWLQLELEAILCLFVNLSVTQCPDVATTASEVLKI